MSTKLVRKVAWITGASSGIGRACALELAARGARVALSARREDRLRGIVDQLERRGHQALAVPCDVCDEQQQKQTVKQIVSHFGQLDVAIASAGFTVDGRIAELSREDWRRQLNTNVVGSALTARFALPELLKTRGRLALIGSVAAFIPAPGFAAYHASKHAVRAIGRTLAVELHGSGVSCTTLHPGFVDTEITQVDKTGRRDPTRADKRPQYLMWSAEDAARVIIDAIERRRRELVFTSHGRFAAFMGSHFPWLMHTVMTRSAMRRRSHSFRVEEV